MRSEEHHGDQSLQGAKKAKQYLNELLNDPNAGLLDHEIIISVNNKLLGTKNNGYCLNERITTYMGQLKVYCPPTEIEGKMQTIIDRFNRKSCLQNLVQEALAEFIIDFLEIHPMPDGNGRTAKFIIWYVLQSYNKLKVFFLMDFKTWRDIIHHKRYNVLLEWFKCMQTSTNTLKNNNNNFVYEF